MVLNNGYQNGVLWGFSVGALAVGIRLYAAQHPGPKMFKLFRLVGVYLIYQNKFKVYLLGS